MTITIDELVSVGCYDISITPCQVQDEKTNRWQMGMCVNIRRGPDEESVAVAVGEDLEEALIGIEIQLDKQNLLPIKEG